MKAALTDLIHLSIHSYELVMGENKQEDGPYFDIHRFTCLRLIEDGERSK